MIFRLAFVALVLIVVGKLPEARVWWAEFSADYDAAIKQHGVPRPR